MVGMAVATIVLSTAAMKVAMRQAARMRVRRVCGEGPAEVTTAPGIRSVGDAEGIGFSLDTSCAIVSDELARDNPMLV